MRDFSQSVLNEDPEGVFIDLEDRAREDMQQQGFDDAVLVRTLDMRYEGQSYEIRVPADRADAFDDYHQQRYGYSHMGRNTQPVTARVQAIGRTSTRDRPNLAAVSDQPRFASIHVPRGWKRRESAGSNTILERIT